MKQKKIKTLEQQVSFATKSNHLEIAAYQSVINDLWRKISKRMFFTRYIVKDQYHGQDQYVFHSFQRFSLSRRNSIDTKYIDDGMSAYFVDSFKQI